MGIEIERKFLVQGDGWRSQHVRTLRQGYLSRKPDCNVRVRTDGERGFLTVKGMTHGATRAEFEYEIPLAEATEMLERMCDGPLIEKRRYRVEFSGRHWEVDEFLGDNAGLTMAEIELSAEHESFERPPWLGEEVTHDRRYLNVNLSQTPFREWQQ